MAYTASFEFPAKDLGGVTQMHIIPYLIYQIFMVWKKKTEIHSYLSFKYFVEDIIIVLIIKC